MIKAKASFKKNEDLLVSITRLKADYVELLKNPVINVKVAIDSKDLLEWHFVIQAPKSNLLTGYCFYGRILFPNNYPFEPPMVVLTSPPFDTCVLPYSFNDRLMEVVVTPYGSILNPPWNPVLTASDVIHNVKSIVLSTIITDVLLDSIGPLDLTLNHRLVKNKENLENPLFCKFFPGVVDEIIGCCDDDSNYSDDGDRMIWSDESDESSLSELSCDDD